MKASSHTLPEPGSKIILGLSGGVDSSVSAYLLKAQGFEVTAVFMKNWEGDDTEEHCPAAKDIQDAKAVCEQLGIEFLTINFALEYWENVFSHFLTEYQAGRTPNPDILCNREIKFKAFLDYARVLGGTHIATGHYAQIAFENGQHQLFKGTDPNKDQSYFLYALKSEHLAHSIFPVGHLLKPQVRALAKQNGLLTYQKKDSTGICFIGERKFKEFLERYLKPKPGLIVNEDGKVLGEHQGLMFHTLGQRQGLMIGGRKESSGEPWYVCEKLIDSNTLKVVQGANHPLLFKSSLTATQITWVNTPPAARTPLFAKIRYRQMDQPCLITQLSEHHLELEFESPQRAVTPGQSVVLYDQSCCLGGGVIT